MSKKSVYMAIFVLINLGFLLTTYEGQTKGVITLPQTGQTKCYAIYGEEINCAGTGQDGELQEGVEWPVPRFTVSGDCIMDNLTGLMWAKNGDLIGGARTWPEALDFVASLNNGAGLCGYNDWRLPNLNELESLVNPELGEIGEDYFLSTWLIGQGFSNMQTNYYWSSTSRTYPYGDPDSAWALTMNDGGMHWFGYYNTRYVWPVRTGQSGTLVPSQIWKTGQTTSYAPGDDGDLEKGVSWPVPRFTDHGNGTITDNLTGLMWSKNADLPNGQETWPDALDYVKSINGGVGLGGYHDWRLPNRKELFSLTDKSKFDLALPASHPFENVQRTPYWTSTTGVHNTANGWSVSMWSGAAVNGGGKSTPEYVWPVRGSSLLTTTTVTTNPPGGEIIVDESSYTSPHTFDWLPSSSHTLSVTSPQSGPSGTQYLFFSWSDGLAQTHTITTPSSNTTYTANFITQYTLTTFANPIEGGNVNPSGTGWYNSGQNVSVSATANPSYTFIGWSGNLSGRTNPTSIIMNGPMNVTAIFERFSLESPSNGAVFDSGSLINNYQPSFTWTSVGMFSKYTILISTSPTDFTSYGIVLNKASVSGAYKTWKPSSFVWKKILKSSYNLGNVRDIYWKIVGIRSDGQIIESEVRSLRIGDPQVVTINTPLNGSILPSSIPPTFNFDTNCNTKFKVEISSLSDFSVSTKIKGFNFTVSNPNLMPSLQKTLSSFQWNGVKKLIGGGTGYFRIKAWDGLSRPTVSEIRSFTIQ